MGIMQSARPVSRNFHCVPGTAGNPPDAPTGSVGMPPPPPDVRRPGRMKPPKEKEQAQTRLDGTVGTGDAVVNLSSFSGSLYLKKQ